MKIKIEYCFYTDGDYSLRNYNNFGCTGREIEIEDEYFDYIGVVNLDNDETWRCKHDAKNFLTQLLCDGIHISYTRLPCRYCLPKLISPIPPNKTGSPQAEFIPLVVW